MLKQILLITDGCSNVGMDPAAAAAYAYEEGIIVNVIGIVDRGEFGSHGAQEIEQIARAGGGMSRIIPPERLAQTVQMMTRHTVTQTIHQAVSRELKQIVGSGELSDLSPPKRERVVQVIEDMSDNAPLRVALLVDASASMKPKLQAVKEAIQDLLLSLQAREGNNELSIFHFPGSRSGSDDIEMDIGWTDNLEKLNRLFYKLNMRGATPTGPALLKVVQYYMYGTLYEDDSLNESDNEQMLQSRPEAGGRDGILGDYVV